MTAIDVAADPFILKQNQDRLSAHFRKKRFGLILDLVREINRSKGACRIVDVGGRAEYWSPVARQLTELRAHVTIVNLESTQPEPGALFDFRYGNACDLSDLDSNTFDLAHSNSLIEHVGNWQAQRRCAEETRRLAPSYYVQTPYFWFPLEPHFRVPFFHWMPEQLRARLVMRRKLGYFNRAATLDQAMQNVQSASLLDARQLRDLFPDAEVSFERVAGIPKSLIATRRA